MALAPLVVDWSAIVVQKVSGAVSRFSRCLSLSMLLSGSVGLSVPMAQADQVNLGVAVGGPYERPVPDLKDLVVFEAKPPYAIETRKGRKSVKLGMYGTKDDVPRQFDFVSPFINYATGRTNFLTAQTPVQTANGLVFKNLSDNSSPIATELGSPGRVEYSGERLLIAYRAFDPPSSEKCRVMINSWPIPTRRELTWDLSFKLGGSLRGEEWPMTKPGTSLTLIWQLKGDPGFPSMGIMVDTSTIDPSKFRLIFFQRLQNRWNYDYRWAVENLEPTAFTDVVIRAKLDDRDEGQADGALQVWVNGRLVAERFGPNLLKEVPDVHRWAFGVYLTSESLPQSRSRVSVWRRARMLVAP